MRAVKGAALLLSCLLSCLIFAGVASADKDFSKYALKSVSAALSSNQAGAPADLSVGFELTSTDEPLPKPFAFTKDLIVSLPPGMIGNPQKFPRCTVTQFGETPQESECPQDAQVGVTEVRLAGTINATLIEPVYNMTSPGGETVARFGFFAGPYPTTIKARLNPVDYSVEAAVEGASAVAEVIGANTTLWAVPASPVHDELRLTPEEALLQELPPDGRASGQPETRFLSNPTDCSAPREITITAVSYQVPDQPSTMSGPFPKIVGCEKLSFGPEFSATPTNPEAFAPTGLDAVLTIPQDETPKGLATSMLKSATVSLPAGMSINPAAGDGLKACSASEVGFGTSKPSDCPDAAKIGSLEVDIPALERTLNGSVYQRTPEPGNLFRFWVVTDEQGVHLKLPAEIAANPLTGQVTTVFNGIPSLGGIPQAPFSQLRLHVFGGPRAPLATPGCGSYATRYEFAPWSGKPAAVGDAPMQITTGCNKGGFAPKLEARTINQRAGSFSPFAMTLTRQDGEANPQSLEVHLPQGLLAKLAGVPLCPEQATAGGDCPPGSQVGHLMAAAGVGGAPLWIPQPGKDPTAIYLAGPYRGAPYSIVSRVPAQAGPFDLGVVVNRAGIYVDPESATATIKADPLPQILEGVPVAYRTIHVAVDRPGFTLNPTNCKLEEIQVGLTASNGATASPSAPFAALGCGDLDYAPKLQLQLKGATRRSGHPALKATLTQKPNQANNAKISVQLPTSQFIDQDHINNPCTRVQFNAGQCPPLSVLGTARAITPLLDQALEGPVYFRSNGGERELPDVVADVRGGGLRIVQVGFVDSVPVKGTELARLRTRFLSLPDAPVSKITLSLFGGKKRGLLENSRNLCKTDRKAKVSFTGHNGAVQSGNLRIATSCRKKAP
ncbi:MAG TPA: hypothetical protein VFS54_02705 [Solirubrobacterales bacterium]|nr:hypothetical protein [Solirubrobacterales bacterium]